MLVASRTAPSLEHEGRRHFFCSAGCRRVWARRRSATCTPRLPNRLPECSPESRASAPRPTRDVPDAPADRRPRSGSCPICGMALEPRSVSSDGESPELTRHAPSILGKPLFTLPLFVLGMARWSRATLSGSLFPHGCEPARARPRNSGRSLGRLAVLRAGVGVGEARSPNMFTLVALGSGAAFLYSVVATSRPARSPRRSASHHGEVGVYFEAAGHHHARPARPGARAPRAKPDERRAPALLGLAPKTARRLRDDGTDEDVGSTQVKVGDRLRVRPGERVPVDGTVSKARARATNR
jgi:Cu+-exporting ATPase